MDESRLKELNFLIRTKTPVPVTERRDDPLYEDSIYDDIYTIKELVEANLLQYIGKDKNYQLFLRPLCTFSIWISDHSDHMCKLQAGEIVTLALTKAGHTEFQEWISTRNGDRLY